MSTETLEIIEVPIALIAQPSNSLILADAAFLTTLKQVEATVAGLKISDAQSSQQAADLTVRLTKAGTTLEKQRVALKAPFLALMAQIDAAAKAPQARIENLKRALSVAQTNFATEQRRLAQEAEKARLAELQRLEAIRLQELAAAKKKADELAEQVRLQNEAKARVIEAARVAGLPIVEEVVEEVWDEEPAEPPQKTETEKAIEAVKFAPAAVVVKAAGIRTVVTLVPFVTDVNKLPDFFVEKSAKIQAIRSTFCTKWKDGDVMPVCDGVRFERQESVQSTGRAEF